LILASGQNASQGEATVNALVSALNDQSLPSASFSDATQRILSLRAQIS
jgi:hypothetical protein